MNTKLINSKQCSNLIQRNEFEVGNTRHQLNN